MDALIEVAALCSVVAMSIGVMAHILNLYYTFESLDQEGE